MAKKTSPLMPTGRTNSLLLLEYDLRFNIDTQLGEGALQTCLSNSTLRCKYGLQ